MEYFHMTKQRIAQNRHGIQHGGVKTLKRETLVGATHAGHVATKTAGFAWKSPTPSLPPWIRFAWWNERLERKHIVVCSCETAPTCFSAHYGWKSGYSSCCNPNLICSLESINHRQGVSVHWICFPHRSERLLCMKTSGFWNTQTPQITPPWTSSCAYRVLSAVSLPRN